MVFSTSVDSYGLKRKPVEHKFYALIRKAKQTLLTINSYLVMIWVIFIFLFQLLGLSLISFASSKFNSGIKPIKFEGDEIWVEKVENRVKIGNLAGNRNLEFGVKNVLEEYLQENGYELNEKSKKTLKVEIIFLDVVTIKQNISVLHKNEESVVIRLRGTLYENGKKVRSEIVEESSSEISMSAVIIDGGGKFNQQSLSNALKKGCGNLITKLTN